MNKALWWTVGWCTAGVGAFFALFVLVLVSGVADPPPEDIARVKAQMQHDAEVRGREATSGGVTTTPEDIARMNVQMQHNAEVRAREARAQEAQPTAADHPSERRVYVTGIVIAINRPVLVLKFGLENRETYPVKDVPVNCKMYAPSGTLIGERTRVAYVALPAHGEAWTKEINFGFTPDQLETHTLTCEARS